MLGYFRASLRDYVGGSFAVEEILRRGLRSRMFASVIMLAQLSLTGLRRLLVGLPPAQLETSFGRMRVSLLWACRDVAVCGVCLGAQA